jgi:hypothetical protein
VNKRNRALLITGIAVLCAVVLCGAGLVIAQRIPGIAGCEEGPPYVSAVQEDVEKIAGTVPDLAEAPSASPDGRGIASTHYRWREARPRTCPDLGPMDYYYEGFAVLTAARAAALRTRYTWSSDTAPDVPAQLSQYAPPGAVWQRSTDLEAGGRAQIWLDRGSDTVYFSYLKS